MVRLLHIFLLSLGGLTSNSAIALFLETKQDLEVLEDAMRYELGLDNEFDIGGVTPILVSQPIHHWKESRDDFAGVVTTSLKKVFQKPGMLIDCPDCNTYRMHATEEQRVHISNGPLSLSDIRKNQNSADYGVARSIAYIKETPSGVSAKIVRIADGVILFSMVADSSQDLEDKKPWLNMQKEAERRKRGESLYFTKFNMGLPLISAGTMQFEFLEQWGTHNQHITGINLSLFNPTAAIGVTYHYLVRPLRGLDVSGAVFFPLQSIANEEGAIESLAFQAGAGYIFSDSFGVFGHLVLNGDESGIVLGLAFYNPILMPFIF